MQKARVDNAIRALADETPMASTAAGLMPSSAPPARPKAYCPTPLTGRSRRLIWTWRTVRGGRRYECCSGSCWLAWSVASLARRSLRLGVPAVAAAARRHLVGFSGAHRADGGGVLAGLLVAGLARIEVGARRRSRNAARALRRSIGKVTDELVLEPVEAERERYEKARVALERVHG